MLLGTRLDMCLWYVIAKYVYLCLSTIYHQVTHKNIWKLCFRAKLHSTYISGLCLYPFGMPKDRTLM